VNDFDNTLCNGCRQTRKAETISWGNIFKSEQKKWKCASCFCQNEEKYTICPSCAVPRKDYGESVAAASSGSAASSKNGAIASSGFNFGGEPPAPAGSSTTTTATATGSGAGFTWGGKALKKAEVEPKASTQGFTLLFAEAPVLTGGGFSFGVPSTTTTTTTGTGTSSGLGVTFGSSAFTRSGDKSNTGSSTPDENKAQQANLYD
jgi:hypothetical protein